MHLEEINTITDHFSKDVVFVPTPKIETLFAVKRIFWHWVSKIGTHWFLKTDRGTECLFSEFANCCTMFKVRKHPTTLFAPWTIGPVEVHEEHIGTHMRLFRMIPLKFVFSKEQFFAHGPRYRKIVTKTCFTNWT